MHVFHAFAVLAAGGNDIDPCGVDTAVAENVGKLCKILFDPVKHACEQMPQIMGKHLLRMDPRLLAKPFHFPPNIGAADRLAVTGDEDCSR